MTFLCTVFVPVVFFSSVISFSAILLILKCIGTGSPSPTVCHYPSGITRYSYSFPIYIGLSCQRQCIKSMAPMKSSLEEFKFFFSKALLKEKYHTDMMSFLFVNRNKKKLSSFVINYHPSTIKQLINASGKRLCQGRIGLELENF